MLCHKKEYGNFPKSVIVKLPHQTKQEGVSVYENYNTNYEV